MLVDVGRKAEIKLLLLVLLLKAIFGIASVNSGIVMTQEVR